MDKIQFSTTMYIGNDSLNRLSQLENQKIFIVADPFVVESNMIQKVESQLRAGGNDWSVFSEIIPDPPVENVVAGVEALHAFEPDTIVTIGGGSAIDAAKAIREFSKRIYDYKNLPLIAIPTTSGTGSEVTSFSVITDNEKGVKYPLVSDSLLPEEAILDPSLVLSVPKHITADTGVDTLTHAIEAYVAQNANAFSDALAEKAIRIVFEHLVDAYRDGDNVEAREQMHYASAMAGMAFNIAGLGINHSIAHSSGAKFHIPHGRLNAILLPSVIAYNAGVEGYANTNLGETADKYAELAKLLGLSATNSAIGTRNLMKEIQKLNRKLEISNNLKDYNINHTEDMLKEIASAALQDDCTLTNPITPQKEDIIKILTDLM